MPSTLIAIVLLGSLSATTTPAASRQNEPMPQVAMPDPSPDRVRLTREHWARPRSGFYVAKLDVLNALIHRFNAQAGSEIVIRYAQGDEGSLWAAELRAWLVSLGISSKYIELMSVEQDEDVLMIENHSKGVQLH